MGAANYGKKALRISKLRDLTTGLRELDFVRQAQQCDTFSRWLEKHGVVYEDEPVSAQAPRRQIVRPWRPLFDMTYGGVSSAWMG